MTVPKRVICINNIDSLTNGKVYEVHKFLKASSPTLALYRDMYIITDDRGRILQYFSWRFKPILDPFDELDAIPIG